jgi:hypothetical protein
MGFKHKKALKEALEKMLAIAKQRLEFYENKNSAWEIEHYKGDIKFIESELEIVNKM